MYIDFSFFEGVIYNIMLKPKQAFLSIFIQVIVIKFLSLNLKNCSDSKFCDLYILRNTKTKILVNINMGNYNHFNKVSDTITNILDSY